MQYDRSYNFEWINAKNEIAKGNTSMNSSMNSSNSWGKTPLDYAIERKYTNIVKIFETNGYRNIICDNVNKNFRKIIKKLYGNKYSLFALCIKVILADYYESKEENNKIQDKHLL